MKHQFQGHLNYKLSLIILKYIPVAMAFVMWIHVYLLIVGHPLKIAEQIAGCTALPCIILLAFSNIMKFCWLHKCYIIYAVGIDYCINIHREIGFYNVQGCRAIAFAIGMLLFGYTIIHQLEHHNWNTNGFTKKY